MAAVKITTQVLYNDGEGLTHGDLNDMQKAAHGRNIDTIIGSMAVGSSPESSTVLGMHGYSSDYCWMMGMNGYPQAHPSTALTVYNSTAGMIAQWVDDAHDPEYVASGTAIPDPKLLVYYVEAETLEFESDPAHATLNRYDCIDIKLELIDGDSQSRDFKDGTTQVISSASMNKKRRVQMTAVLTKGANNATPGLPNVPAGYCRYAGVYVPATHAAVFSNTDHVLDFCMPMRGVGSETVHAVGIINPNNAATHNGDSLTLDAGDAVYVNMRNNGAFTRVAKVGLITSLSGGTVTNTYHRYSHGLTGTGLFQPFGAMAIGSGANAFTVSPLISNYDGNTLPVWGNGYRAGRACFFANYDAGTNWATSFGVSIVRVTGSPIVRAGVFSYYY